VVYGPDGKLMTVRYSMLSAMLLNELQKQAKENQRLSAQVAQLKGMFEQAMAAQRGSRSLQPINASRASAACPEGSPASVAAL